MASLTEESLFSLEIVVDKLTLPKIQCRFPAIAFRLLDFPTIMIYHVEPELGDSIKAKIRRDPLYRLGSQIPELVDKNGSFSVQKGKSCLMKIAPNDLVSHLSSTPLYVIVIDTFPETPKLIGNCTVPLDDTMNKLYEDICKVGLAVPTVQGEKGFYKIYNLMGNQIGGLVLGLRILSLGVGLIPHIAAKSVSRYVKKEDEHNLPSKREQNKIQKQVAGIALKDFDDTAIELQNAVVCSKEAANTSAHGRPISVEKVQMPTQTEREILQNIATQTDKRVKQKQQKAKLDIQSQIRGDLVDDIVVTNTVCPPPLYFNSDIEPKNKHSLALLTSLLNPEPKAVEVEHDSSDDDTIRVEDVSADEFDLESTAIDTFKVRKSKQKPFVAPSNVGGLLPNLKEFPLLQAIMTEIAAISGAAIEKTKPAEIVIAKPKRASSISPKRGHRPREASSSPRRGRSPSPRRERASVDNFVKRMHSPKHTLRELPIIKPTYDTSHLPTPRKPTHSNKCDHGHKPVPKTKSWIRKTPVPMEVKKTKLSYGLTNTQRLRLEKSNPELLKSLEMKEAERVQRFKEQRRLEEEAKIKQFGATKKLYDGTAQRGKILNKPHKRPVPTPRHSIHSTHDTLFNEDHPLTTIQQVHEEYRYQYNATPDIDMLAEKGLDSGEYVENQYNEPRKFAPQSELPQRPGQKHTFGETKVIQNDPGFPVSETEPTGDKYSYADDFDDPTERSEKSQMPSLSAVPERSYYHDENGPKAETDNIQVKALDPVEVLGLRQMNEMYSDEESDSSEPSFKSAISASDHVEVKPYPVTQDKASRNISPPMPSDYKPSLAENYSLKRGAGKSGVTVDASVESTAYISRSQVFNNQSQESLASSTDAPKTPAKKFTHRVRRNTDSVSSYVGEDDNSQHNYSDESLNGSDASLSDFTVPDPLSMKDMQISKEAKLGYTWA